MHKNILKTICISFIVLFSALFTNIDGVKADIPYCSTNDKYVQAASCDYPNKGLFTTQLDLQVFFAKTESGNYCAEISNIKLESWADFNNSDQETNKGKIAFDLSDDTMNSILTERYCPELKFVNDYNALDSITEKFTVSDKDLNYPACVVSQIASFGSECWVLPGEKFKTISSEEMENAVQEGSGARNHNENNIEIIKQWGEKAKEGEYSSEDAGTTCNSINEIGKLLNTILWVVDIIAIIILIIMTMADFIKAIVGSNPDDTLKASFKHLITRAIIVVILLLLPVILGSIISMVNQETGKVEIGENGEPFCNIGN